MEKGKITLLKVLVGSRANGLADENSDYDYRSVYVLPTSKILSLGYKYKGNDWIEGNEDNTAYEIGHFLELAMKCNPSILEILKSPVQYANEDGVKLLKLFPYLWNPKDAFNAFIGYGLKQRKNLLDKEDDKQTKYGVTYLRTLYNLTNLLLHKDFSSEIKDEGFKKALKGIKQGFSTYGEIIDAAKQLTAIAKICLIKCEHEPNLDKVNEFLVEIRRKYWE